MNLSNEYLVSQNGLDLLNKIFRSAGEGIVIVNASGEILMSNHRAEEIFGYQEKELHGEKIERLIPGKYRKNHVKHREGYIKHPVSRPMGLGLDLEGLRKDGTEFPIEISLSYLTHDDEKLVVAFITDITLRKQQEQILVDSRRQLETHAQDLEKEVKNRTRELEHLNLGLKSQIRERKLAEAALQESLEELKKAEKETLKALEKEKELNEMKSRFISMASHEFRTPLTTILSSANLIQKYQESDHQPNREKHIDRIRSSVNNLTNILNDFLSLEKLETGVIEVKFQTFNLQTLIEEVIENMELSKKKGQSIEVDFQIQDSEIITDAHLLKNILLNLLSNAIKYSPEGKPVTVIVNSKNEQLQVTVSDQGIGIPESEQKNLFQRFYRADNATNIQGTGLGLNIVKRYLDLLNGTVGFESKPGEGSQFYFTIPLQNTKS